MKIFLIKCAYWLGNGANVLWGLLLVDPQLFGALPGRSDFSPDLQARLIIGIVSILIIGCTFILLKALQKSTRRKTLVFI